MNAVVMIMVVTKTVSIHLDLITAPVAQASRFLLIIKRVTVCIQFFVSILLHHALLL
jgi:hypothetical protein